MVNEKEITGVKNSRSKLLFEDPAIWYSIQLDPIVLDARASKNISSASINASNKADIVKNIRAISENIATTESKLFESQKSKSSTDHKWAKTIIKNGTMADRISALALSISESYIHHFPHLDSLMALAKKKSPREAAQAVDVLKGVFLGVDSSADAVLPSDRKLRFLHEQPDLEKAIMWLKSGKLISEDGQPAKDLAKIPVQLCQHLCLWFIEDHAKRNYYQWILCLDSLGKNPIANIRNKVLNHAWELLVAKPEQERTLLSLIVNKFGDLDKKVASKVVFLLLKLFEEHGQMKLSVAKEVEMFIHRDGISNRAKYYALVFLNQIPFFSKNDNDRTCAIYLCGVYFKLFEMLISKEHQDELSKKKKKKPSEEEVKMMDKMMAAILTGISRAYPYALNGDSNNDGKVEEFFSKNIDSLFRAVHLPSCSFKTSVQALHIIYRMIFHTKEGEESAKIISTKLFNRYCRALYSLLFSMRLTDSSKTIGLFLNLIYKTLKECPEENAMFAVLKRTLQVSVSGTASDNSAFVNAALVALSEGVRQNENEPLKKRFQLSINQSPDDDLESDEECFKDVDEDGDDMSKETRQIDSEKLTAAIEAYDPFHRCPDLSQASKGRQWEMALLAQHYHPTTRLFAKTLLSQNENKEQQYVNYPSDPLVDFTTSRFLDKFVYRNPKKAKEDDDTMKRAKPSSSVSRLTHEEIPMKRKDDIPASNVDWETKMKTNNVASDEMFFATYFSNCSKSMPKKLKAELDSDLDDMDEEFDMEDNVEELDVSEDEIENAIMNSFPDKDALNEANVDEDSDPEFDSDFMDAEMEQAQNGSVEEIDMEEMNEEEIDQMEEEEDIEEEEDDEEDEDFDFGEFDDDSEESEDQLSEEDEDGLMSDTGSITAKKNHKNKTRKKKNESGVDMDKTLRNAIASQKGENGKVFAAFDDFAHLMDQSDDKLLEALNAMGHYSNKKQRNNSRKKQRIE